MDAIADRAFVEKQAGGAHRVVDEMPSLLSVILDVNPLEWQKLIEGRPAQEGQEAVAGIEFRQVAEAVLVMLNSHMALNSGNKVALYLANSFSHGAELVFPAFNKDGTKGVAKESSGKIKSKGIYRQFRIIDETVVQRLEAIVQSEPERLKKLVSDDSHIKGTLSGALSQALCYINRMQNSEEMSGLKARILCVSVSDDKTLPYVSIMNSIFAAQKRKVSVDVCKLGPASTFLQQAADATNGVYITIKHPEGLVQYLSTALFIEPMLRPIVVLPTNTSIDFRASCFITNQVVDVGYVCSVCLCILSVIPDDEKCPTCHSKFDHGLIQKLKRKPRVLPLKGKKRKASA